MAFDEVRLPTGVERGAVGGPGFLTNVVALNSGREQRNSLWSVDRGRWDIGYGIQTRADALAVRDFFMARLGRARGFRFRDWTNYTTENFETGVHTQQPTSERGDGSETVFQMYYRYQDTGGFYYEKAIYKPVASSITVYIDGEEVTTGVSVDRTTGLISFASAPNYGRDVTWTGTFDLPVRFDTDKLDMVVTTKNVIAAPAIPIVELKM